MAALNELAAKKYTDTDRLWCCFVLNVNFIVLGDGINRGPGYAFNTGFEWVLANSKNIESDIVITMEADCTSDIGILPHMLGINKMGYDLVLASVYAQGGGFDSTSFLRKFLSAMSTLIISYLEQF